MSAEASSDREDRAETDEYDHADLEAQRDVLLEENQRLREEYSRAKRAQYRRTAVGLVLTGALAAVAGYLFPVARTVLFVLAGIGIFGGVLTAFLTPERFIAADVGAQVYGALADNESAIVSDLGLSEERVYVPTEDGTRLYVPQQAEARVPRSDLDQVFVVTDDETTRGVAFEPTGEPLFDEFERTVTGDLATDPEPLTDQLVDALVSQFELVDSVGVDLGDQQATFELVDPAYGDVNRFDHPVASVLAVGLSHGLDRPVRIDVDADEERPIIRCHWDDRE